MLLPITFFCEDPVDLEHKQYVLMAFFQKVDKMLRDGDVTSLEEVRYHCKNMECFVNTRGLLEGRGFPVPTAAERKLHEKIRNLPDADERYSEAIKICKWALKRLQERVKEGGVIHKRVEGSLKLYYIGKELQKNTGYLMVRYLGSDVAEVYRMTYNYERKDVTFRSMGEFPMPGKKDFSDVKMDVLRQIDRDDDLFVAVEGQKSFNTKKTTLPVLKGLLISNVFEKKNGGFSLSWKL